jgi:hypothetical protein
VTNTDFAVCDNDEAVLPLIDVFCFENALDSIEQGFSSRILKTNEQQSVMGSRLKLANIGEVEVGRDEKSLGILCGGPDGLIIFAGELLHCNGIDIVAERDQSINQAHWHVLIEFQVHQHLGDAGNCGDWEVFFSRRRCKCDDGTEVFLCQRRKVGEDFRISRAFREAR